MSSQHACSSLVDKSTVISKIKEALAGQSNALRLYYQPIKRINEITQPAYFFEALVRYLEWEEAVVAERFIPLVLLHSEVSQEQRLGSSSPLWR